MQISLPLQNATIHKCNWTEQNYKDRLKPLQEKKRDEQKAVVTEAENLKVGELVQNQTKIKGVQAKNFDDTDKKWTKELIKEQTADQKKQLKNQEQKVQDFDNLAQSATQGSPTFKIDSDENQDFIDKVMWKNYQFPTLFKRMHDNFKKQMHKNYQFSIDTIKFRNVFKFGQNPGFIFGELKYAGQGPKPEKWGGPANQFFLRGPSVQQLIVLKVEGEDFAQNKKYDYWTILTVQPRVPQGYTSFPEIPQGMLDDSDSFAGQQQKEIEEETGLKIREEELQKLNMSKYFFAQDQSGEQQWKYNIESKTNSYKGKFQKKTNKQALQTHVKKIEKRFSQDKNKKDEGLFTSPGGCDEQMNIYYVEKEYTQEQFQDLLFKTKLITEEKGEENTGEQIEIMVVPLEDVPKHCPDMKSVLQEKLYKDVNPDYQNSVSQKNQVDQSQTIKIYKNLVIFFGVLLTLQVAGLVAQVLMLKQKSQTKSEGVQEETSTSSHRRRSTQHRRRSSNRRRSTQQRALDHQTDEESDQSGNSESESDEPIPELHIEV